jgi:hypothetical protein
MGNNINQLLAINQKATLPFNFLKTITKNRKFVIAEFFELKQG